MFIPQTMKTAIAEAFYDKEVHRMEQRTETDAEGAVKTLGYAVKESFFANVNCSNCEKIQEDYGLDYRVDITLSTHYSKLKKEDMIFYHEQLYTVKGIYPRDSHVFVVGTSWRT